MNQINQLNPKKLIALQFESGEEFKKAKFIATKKKIPIITQGNYTVVIHRKKRRFFSNLAYNEIRINGNSHTP